MGQSSETMLLPPWENSLEYCNLIVAFFLIQKCEMWKHILKGKCLFPGPKGLSYVLSIFLSLSLWYFLTEKEFLKCSANLLNTFRENHLIPLLYFNAKRSKLPSKLLCLVWMIVQAEHQVLELLLVTTTTYRENFIKYHIITCAPSFVLLLIPLCFASRLCSAVLEAEVDATEKAMMSTLSIIFVDADNRDL